MSTSSRFFPCPWNHLTFHRVVFQELKIDSDEVTVVVGMKYNCKWLSIFSTNMEIRIQSWSSREKNCNTYSPFSMSIRLINVLVVEKQWFRSKNKNARTVTKSLSKIYKLIHLFFLSKFISHRQSQYTPANRIAHAPHKTPRNSSPGKSPGTHK